MSYQLLHAYLKGRDSYVAHELLGPPSGRLLDVGSGEGEDLRRLVALGWRAVGVEPFQRAVGLPIVRGTAERLPFRDGAFDAISCILVLPHFAESDEPIAEAHRVLRPGGQAVFVVFSKSPLNVRVALTGHRYASGMRLPSRLHSSRELRDLMLEAGFRRVRCIRTDYLPWFADRVKASLRRRLLGWLERMDRRLGRTPLRFAARKLVLHGVRP